METAVSISQLKARPAKALSQAEDYPLVIKSRNRTKAYLLGKVLFEKIIAFIEDFIDKKAVRETDFTKGKNFEKLAKNLGV